MVRPSSRITIHSLLLPAFIVFASFCNINIVACVLLLFVVSVPILFILISSSDKSLSLILSSLFEIRIWFYFYHNLRHRFDQYRIVVILTAREKIPRPLSDPGARDGALRCDSK